MSWTRVQCVECVEYTYISFFYNYGVDQTNTEFRHTCALPGTATYYNMYIKGIIKLTVLVRYCKDCKDEYLNYVPFGRIC